MKYKDYINESKTNMEKELSMLVDMDVIIKGDKIYTKDDNKLIIQNINKMNYDSVIQSVIDFIDKNYPNEFDLEDSIQSLIYTQVPIKQVDELLLKPRTYNHKPLYCITSNDTKNHGYIVGFTGKLNNIIDTIGLPKEGYSIYILDGKFEAIKTRLDNGLLAYVISPSYNIRISDGLDTINLYGKEYKVKHIRRKI